MIFVVVPAYNEAKNIGRVVRGLFEQGWNNVLVVDDGSGDDTAAIATAAGAVVLRHAVNLGQGAALQTGTEYALRAGADIVVHFDGDGQFNPADIKPAVELLRGKNLDAVFGSRFLDKRSRLPFFKRRAILPAARLVNFLFTGVWLSDAHNGFRVLSRRAAAGLDIRRNGMAHNSEIVGRIKKCGLRFAEHPVEVRYFEYGQGIGGGLKIVGDLILEKFLNL